MLHDYLISLIRTAVPVAIGTVLASLASRAGIVLDADSSTQLVAATVALVVLAYYALVRALEARWPFLGVLLGKPAAPVYGLPPAQSESTADLYPDGTPRQIRSVTTWPPRQSGGR